jgi:hypothetical protein
VCDVSNEVLTKDVLPARATIAIDTSGNAVTYWPLAMGNGKSAAAATDETCRELLRHLIHIQRLVVMLTISVAF